MKNKIINSVLDIILAYSIILTTVLSYNFVVKTTNLFLIIIGLYLVLSLVLFNKYTFLVTSLCIGASLLNTEVRLLITNWIYNIVEWFIDYCNYLELYDPEQALKVVILISILLIILIKLLGKTKYGYFILFILGATLFNLQWYADTFRSMFSFMLFIFVITVKYSEFIYKQKYTRKIKFSIYKNIVLRQSIITLVTFVIVFGLLKITHNPLGKVYEYVNNKFPQENTSLTWVNHITYTSELKSKLGGAVTLDDTLVLTVNSEESLYLKGSSLTEYTGTSWVDDGFEYTNYSDSNNPVLVDTLLFVEGLPYLTGKPNIKVNLTTQKIEVQHKNLKTNVLFIPNNSISIKSKDKIIVNQNSIAQSTKDIKSNKSYYIDVYSIDRNDIEDALKNSYIGFYNDLLNNTNVKQTKKLKELANYNDAIYKKYLQLPKTLPKRVLSLASDITQNSYTRYDKAVAIEKYLSTNYTYTLSPSNLPEGRDFVDYFLFDSKTGYCTYYASSMTVLLRSIGIPARYVEGYKMPDTKDKDTGMYNVTSKQAHAWVEAYFEGAGWLVFEPTSSYSAITTSSNTSPADNAFTPAPNSLNNKSQDEPKMNENIPNIGNDAPTLQPIKKITESLPDRTKSNPIVIIIAIIVTIFMLCIILKKKYLSNISKLGTRQRILRLGKKTYTLLEFQGYKRVTSETPLEYCTRLHIETDNKYSYFTEVTNIYMKALYSRLSFTKSEIQLMEMFYVKLLQDTKQSMPLQKRILYLIGLVHS